MASVKVMSKNGEEKVFELEKIQSGQFKIQTKLGEKIEFVDINKEDNNVVKIHKSLFWDKDKQVLIENNKVIKLTKKEIILIDIILKHNGRIYTAEELINAVWNEVFDVNADIKNLKNIISRLRKKIPNLQIKNIYGMGYKVDLPIID